MNPVVNVQMLKYIIYFSMEFTICVYMFAVSFRNTDFQVKQPYRNHFVSRFFFAISSSLNFWMQNISLETRTDGETKKTNRKNTLLIMSFSFRIAGENLKKRNIICSLYSIIVKSGGERKKNSNYETWLRWQQKVMLIKMFYISFFHFSCSSFIFGLVCCWIWNANSLLVQFVIWVSGMLCIPHRIITNATKSETY